MAEETLARLVRAPAVVGALPEYIGPRDRCSCCQHRFAVGDEVTLIAVGRFAILCHPPEEQDKPPYPCWYQFLKRYQLGNPLNQLLRFVGRTASPTGGPS